MRTLAGINSHKGGLILAGIQSEDHERDYSPTRKQLQISIPELRGTEIFSNTAKRE